MPVIHRNLYQVIDAEADNIDTFEISDDHDWLDVDYSKPDGKEWKWDPNLNEPVLANTTDKWDEDSNTYVEDPGKVDEKNADEKRQARNQYILLTDPMVSIPDYTINDVLLTEQQKTDLTTWRLQLKAMPTHVDWPNNDFPEPEQWIQDLAVAEGYELPSEWIA